MMRRIMSLLLVIPLVFMTGCVSDSSKAVNTTTNKTPSGTSQPIKSEELNQDLKSITKVMNLPYQPKRVLFQYTAMNPNKNEGKDKDVMEVPGPSEYQLVALLEFDPATIEEIRKQLKETPSNKSYRVLDEMIEQWYTKEQQAEIKKNNKALIEDWYPDYVKKEYKELEKTAYLFTGYHYPTTLFAKQPFERGYIFFAPHNTVFVYMHTGL